MTDRQNTNLPLVSIIVPVYNVERYIARGIQSLIAQDYKKIEIILVDDGSKDSSGAIVDQYAQTDQRIRVIHQENAGVSSARNAGLRAAEGAYILFVDGDDFVEKDYVSYFLHLIEDNRCDVAMSNSFFTIDCAEQNPQAKDHVISAECAVEQIYLGKIHEAVWNKIYKKSFLDANHLSFSSDIWFGEGMLFNIRCLQDTDHIAVGERRVYHQECNPDSAMRKFNLESHYCGMRSLELQKKSWKKTNSRIERAWRFHYRCYALHILSGLIRTNTVEEHKELFRKCKRALRKNVTLPLLVDLTLKRKAFWIAVSISPVMMAKRDVRKSMEQAHKATRLLKQKMSEK